MPLTRTPHWATREFDAFLRANARAPFVWGKTDCCLFPADAIQSFTGTDLAADFRGKYTDQASAFAAIKSIASGTTVADAVAYCAGKASLVEWTHPLCAQRGDLVVMQNIGTAQLTEQDAQDSLIAGVVGLDGTSLLTVGERGLVRLPLTAVQRAWKV